MPRLLDLFCGAGGAAMGYHRAGFEVVGVDIKPQKHYPFEFHLADAMTYPLDGFDVIHASPPCQGYSRMRHLVWMRERQYPMLIGAMRERLQLAGVPYVIENVSDAPMPAAMVLCGLSFGLRMYRHRKFESNIFLFAPPHTRHEETIFSGRMLNNRYTATSGVAGLLPDPAGHTAGVSTRADALAMGVEWMSRDEMTQAIPPAYTEFIGRQLMAMLDQEAAS